MNSNILRRASRFILSEACVRVVATGKKARDFMVRTKQDLVAEFTQLGDNVSLDDIRPIAHVALDDFITGKVDAVYVVYARFVNTLTQVPELKQVLPIVRPESELFLQYIFEPSPAAVLESLLPRSSKFRFIKRFSKR